MLSRKQVEVDVLCAHRKNLQEVHGGTPKPVAIARSVMSIYALVNALNHSIQSQDTNSKVIQTHICVVNSHTNLSHSPSSSLSLLLLPHIINSCSWPARGSLRAPRSVRVRPALAACARILLYARYIRGIRVQVQGQVASFPGRF